MLSKKDIRDWIKIAPFLFLSIGLVLSVFLVLQRQLVSKKAASLNETVYYVHTDHLGSTTIVTDASGNSVSNRIYFPFGNTRSSTGSNLTDRLYTGQVSDQEETELYYYNNRYYSPSLGKFTQADTVDDQLNRYAYVGNNPVRLVDPSGNMMSEGEGGTSSNPSEAGGKNQEIDEFFSLETGNGIDDELAIGLGVVAAGAKDPFYWPLFHFMKHAESAGFSGHNLTAVKGFLNFISTDIVQKADYVMYRPSKVDINGNVIKSAYIFIKEIGGQKWAAFISPDGKIITAYNLGLSHLKWKESRQDRELAKLVQQGAREIQTGVPQAIVKNWIQNTPSVFRVLAGAAWYEAAQLTKRTAETVSSRLGTPIIIVPAGVFDCSFVDPAFCGNNQKDGVFY